MSKSEEIQAKIEQLRQAAAGLHPMSFSTSPEIAKIQLEVFVLAAQLAEISSQRLEGQTNELIKQTDRLVGETVTLRRFTRGLFWLTVIITIFTVVQIVIAYFDYSAKANERPKPSIQNHQTS